MADTSMETCINDTLLETIKLSDFKKAGAEGIVECKIKSNITTSC